MPVECPNCHTTFGDLQYKIREKYDFFNERITNHICPKCKSIVHHNWATLEDWIDEKGDLNV